MIEAKVFASVSTLEDWKNKKECTHCLHKILDLKEEAVLSSDEEYFLRASDEVLGIYEDGVIKTEDAVYSNLWTEVTFNGIDRKQCVAIFRKLERMKKVTLLSFVDDGDDATFTEFKTTDGKATFTVTGDALDIYIGAFHMALFYENIRLVEMEDGELFFSTKDRGCDLTFNL